MDTVRTNCPLKAHCEVNHLFYGWVCFIFFLQIWLVNDSIFQLHMMAHHWIRHELCNPIRLRIRHIQYARHITHGVLRHHLTKGYDVTHATLAILLRTVFNHLIATVILNIGINIRHRDTVWVQEALKEKIVLQRVQISNMNCVRKERTCRRTTAWTINNTLVFTPVNEVLHNQEVTVVAHVIDGLELKVDALKNFLRKHLANLRNRRFLGFFLRHITITLSKTSKNQFIEIFLLRLAGFNWEFRNQNATKINRHITALGNLLRIENRLRASLLPTRDQFIRRNHVQLEILERHALFVLDTRASTNTQKHLVRVLVLMLDIVRVASHHERQIKLFRELHQLLVNLVLNIPMRWRIWVTMVLHLEVETPLKGLRIPLNQFPSAIQIIVANCH